MCHHACQVRVQERESGSVNAERNQVLLSGTSASVVRSIINIWDVPSICNLISLWAYSSNISAQLFATLLNLRTPLGGARVLAELLLATLPLPGRSRMLLIPFLLCASGRFSEGLPSPVSKAPCTSSHPHAQNPGSESPQAWEGGARTAQPTPAAPVPTNLSAQPRAYLLHVPSPITSPAGNVYKFQTGSRFHAILWHKHLDDACKSNRPQVITCILLSP